MSIVTQTRTNNIMWAEINRPSRNNAVNLEVMAILENILDDIEQDPDIRVFILSGAGDSFFISGGDLHDFARLKTNDQGREMASRMTAILKRIESARFWSIACINGDAYGGGCEIMLAFDFIIARKTAKFCFTQGNFGLPPGWGGLTRLVERVGRSRALEWLGSSAIVPADAAYNTGLINRLSVTSDLRENTWAFAEEFSQSDSDLTSCLKEGTRITLETDRIHSFQNELDQFSRFWGHDTHHKRVEEFINRKTSG